MLETLKVETVGLTDWMGQIVLGFDGWEDEEWDIICRLGKETAMPRQFARCVNHFTQSQCKD